MVKPSTFQDDSDRSIVTRQLEIFYSQYDAEKYEKMNEEDKKRFVIQINYWIRKFKTVVEFKTVQTSVYNVLIRFTEESDAFKHPMSLETINMLLPYLQSLLKTVKLQDERDGIPTLRKNSILPVGTATIGEIKLELAEKVGRDFITLSDEQVKDYINSAQKEVAELYNKAGGTAYIMDTTTAQALEKQQRKENEEKFKKLIRLRAETLKAIEDLSSDSEQRERVRLQRRSVDITLRIQEFTTWFKSKNIPIPAIQPTGVNDKPKRPVVVTQEPTNEGLATKIEDDKEPNISKNILQEAESIIEMERELNEITKKRKTKTKQIKRKKIRLIDAARACKRIKLGRRKKDNMIDICKDFLKRNEIIGKPKYSPSKLSNYISQVRDKL
jgi:hypothetical protein